MNHYQEELKNIEKACVDNFESTEEDESESADQEYKAIREKALELLDSASRDMDEKEYVNFKKLVFDFLCDSCGCHLDYEVLKKYSPKVLSDTDIEYIVENSALARWF